jgi:hypothetical protein
MEYPKPRYRDPIMVDPSHYDWQPVAGMPGVSEKFLGRFTERQCGAALLQLAADASYRADSRSVYLVVAGSGIADDQPYRQFTALHLDDGETASFVAREPTEILRLVLPDLSGIEMPRTESVQAAE